METSVFFSHQGYTSTSANHLANLAKEYIRDLQGKVDNITFLNVKVSLLDSPNEKVTRIGYNENLLNCIPQWLVDIAEAKSLIAWLREAIKAKDEMFKIIQETNLEEWCKNNNIPMPTRPMRGHILTEEEYYNSLSIKERNRYYSLETKAAVIGKIIHPEGAYSTSRDELISKLQNPIKITGNGRDSILTYYEASVSLEKVDAIYFALQKEHREIQAELNSMKHDCQVAIEESTNRVNLAHTGALAEYNKRIDELNDLFINWKDTEAQKCRQLKIIIPAALNSICEKVNKLGK